MKRRDRREMGRNKYHNTVKGKRPAKWLVISNVIIGVVGGVCFWYFVSRCEDKNCFSYYFPLTEVFCFTILFGTAPYVFFSDK